jgi:ubiquinone/menaquinone biosynthesis C-methylase UbiE
MKEVLAALAPGWGDIILDAGCGTGRLSRTILRFGSTVVGCHISFTMLEECRKHVRSPINVMHSVQADISALPFKDQVFDKAVCTQTIEHIPFSSEPQEAIPSI